MTIYALNFAPTFTRMDLLGLSQRKVSHDTHIPRATLTRMRQTCFLVLPGKGIPYMPSIIVLATLALYLHCAIEDLFQLTFISDQVTDQDLQMLEAEHWQYCVC